jgi:hypothetical protein
MSNKTVCDALTKVLNLKSEIFKLEEILTKLELPDHRKLGFQVRVKLSKIEDKLLKLVK